MSKNRLLHVLGSAVDSPEVTTSKRPLKGFPNHSMTIQSVFDGSEMNSSVDISNLDPIQQMEGGFRMIELLCNHLSKSLVPPTPNINDPTYRLLQTGIGKYREILQQSEEAIRLISD